jgi:hypothetical protein|tara:strand:- start:2720 stop:3733 length:1014 start_codon:yes stop_codon:yes gene_type:complete
MKNRILKRPMFRMGGSTDGILTGLDTPQLEASRTGYQEGDLVSDVRRMYPELKDLKEEIIGGERGRGAPGSVSNFLTGFGLNLLSQPGGSNIFQTAAKAAQTPYQQFVSARQREQDLDTARDEALFGDTLDAARRIREAKIEGESGGKGFQFEAEQEAIGKLQEAQKELKDKLKELDKPQTGSDIDIEERQPGIEKAKADLERQISNNKVKQELITGAQKDPVASAILKGVANGIFTFDQYEEYKKTGKVPREGSAEGGRIGYQEGSMVEAPTRSEVANLDFSTLRSRLPKEIGDDIVKLIADSGEALTDFANIRTQQDVDDFNQRYKVDLVLPAEV